MTQLPEGSEVTNLLAEAAKWKSRAEYLDNAFWRIFCLMLAILPKDRIDDAIQRLMRRAQVLK